MIVELPDNESAAAVAHRQCGRRVTKTVVLLTPDEVDAAAKQSVDYKPPPGPDRRRRRGAQGAFP